MILYFCGNRQFNFKRTALSWNNFYF